MKRYKANKRIRRKQCDRKNMEDNINELEE
jgi:hypothetical protein